MNSGLGHDERDVNDVARVNHVKVDDTCIGIFRSVTEAVELLRSDGHVSWEVAAHDELACEHRELQSPLLP